VKEQVLERDEGQRGRFGHQARLFEFPQRSMGDVDGAKTGPRGRDDVEFTESCRPSTCARAIKTVPVDDVRVGGRVLFPAWLRTPLKCRDGVPNAPPSRVVRRGDPSSRFHRSWRWGTSSHTVSRTRGKKFDRVVVDAAAESVDLRRQVRSDRPRAAPRRFLRATRRSSANRSRRCASGARSSLEASRVRRSAAPTPSSSILSRKRANASMK
jgi:hypothetical protein